MALSDKQRGVLRGVVAGAVITVVALGASVAFSPISLIPDPSLGERLAFVLKADTLIVIWLAICVARLGQHRFSTPEDIDGGGLSTGSQQAHVLQSILQNTLEQTVLAVLVHTIWAVVMPLSWVPAVLAAAILFFLGRILFSRGFSGGAPSRALGFALTFYPSLLMLFLVVVTVVLKLMD